jgi:hypothetical protein
VANYPSLACLQPPFAVARTPSAVVGAVRLLAAARHVARSRRRARASSAVRLLRVATWRAARCSLGAARCGLQACSCSSRRTRCSPAASTTGSCRGRGSHRQRRWDAHARARTWDTSHRPSSRVRERTRARTHSRPHARTRARIHAPACTRTHKHTHDVTHTHARTLTRTRAHSRRRIAHAHTRMHPARGRPRALQAWARMGARKQLFVEPKGAGGEFSACIEQFQAARVAAVCICGVPCQWSR